VDHNKVVLQKIRIWGLASIVLSAVVVAFIIANEVRAIVISGAANVVAAGSNSLVQGVLNDAGVASFDDASSAKMTALVNDRRKSANLLAFRVIDLNGRVVYSSEPDTANGGGVSDEFDVQALAGRMNFRIVDADNDAVMIGAKAEKAIKVYAPLHGGGQKVIGVVETYKPYEQIAVSVRNATLIVWIPIIIGVVVSYAGLLWVVRRASHAISVRDAELASLNARLHTSMLELEDQSLGTLQALSSAVDEKDSYTARHSLGVTGWAHHIGVAAGLSTDELATLERASLLHDIGKIGVPETVLLKPGSLTQSEFDLIKDHPGAGARILEAIPFLEAVVPVVRYHHERWDGTGYPEGLVGEAIPYLARILAIADAFDAMITDRPYRRAMSAEEARREVTACAGTQFDPAIAVAFVSSAPPASD